MGYQAGARDLRELLSVAAKLRHLAEDTLCQGDKGLYLMAAEALEKRAEWLAVTLPPDQDTQPQAQKAQEPPRPRQPVDVRV
jgi:hypothetical protein